MKKGLFRILVLLMLINSCNAPMIDTFRALFNRNRASVAQANAAKVNRKTLIIQSDARGSDLASKIRAKATAKTKRPAQDLRAWGQVRKHAGKAPFRNARVKRTPFRAPLRSR